MGQSNPIAALLTVDQVDLGLRAGDKPDLLAALARKAETMTKVPRTDIVTALLAREALGSTGVGAGIAVPHARIAALPRTFVLFARLEKPIAFDSIDRLPVDLVMLLLSPAKANAEHLTILAAISRRLRDKPVAGALRAATSPAEALAALVGV